MDADVEHHQEDSELTEDVDRLVAAEDPDERRAQEDARSDLTQDRWIPHPSRDPPTEQSRRKDESEHEDFFVHQRPS